MQLDGWTAPTLSLLPQERGPSPAAGKSRSLVNRPAVLARFPLSWGERDRVRASVHSNETSRQQVPNEGRKDGAELLSGDKSCRPTEERRPVTRFGRTGRGLAPQEV